jgi:hypothetical protein
MPTADEPRDPSAPQAAPRLDMIARRSDEPEDDFDDDLDADERDADATGDDAEVDDDDDDLDDEFPLGEGVADTAAEVWCPYCGEPSEIVVDPGGGNLQRYVEDCPVCCRPWQVTVHFASDGTVSVACEADDASIDDMD